MTGLQTCIQIMTSNVKSGLNASLPTLGSVLNRPFKHRISERQSDSAFLNGDLSGMVYILREDYKSASLAALSTELKTLFSLKHDDPLQLDAMLTTSFNTFDYLNLWKYFHHVTLRALLLTTGVKDEYLSKQLDRMQLSYLRDVEEKMSAQNISMDEAFQQLGGTFVY